MVRETPTLPLFRAPFNVIEAVRLLESSNPRTNVPNRFINKRMLTQVDVATIVKTSVHNIRKLIKTLPLGPEAAMNIKWEGRGRPPKNHLPPRTEK